MAEQMGGKFAYEGIDRLLHERARLSIMASLYTRREGHSFNELKKLCSLTDGNLSRHISILKDAALLDVKKGYQKNKPVTRCVLTESGRRRFRAYLDELEQVIRDAAVSEKQSGEINEIQGFSPAWE